MGRRGRTPLGFVEVVSDDQRQAEDGRDGKRPAYEQRENDHRPAQRPKHQKRLTRKSKLNCQPGSA